jgi:hypothetical protein
MTLLVRDEADIVDAQLAFHLRAGVDYVVAMDNRSSDGTTEILERYQRDGRLHLVREEGDDMRQDEWVTRMARLAATDFGADWVINSDADEFWWPRGGTLKEVFAQVPPRFGVIRGVWRHFRPRVEEHAFFAERMDVRVCNPAFPGEKSTIYHAHQKVAHRACADVVVEAGNHNADGRGLEPLRTWLPIEVLHFSLRSAQQMAKKARGGWARTPGGDLVGHQQRLYEAAREGSVDAFFESLAVADDELAAGLADRTLAIDTRLRDVLQTLRDADGTFRPPAADDALAFAAPTPEDNAAFAVEASVLTSIDAIHRAERRADLLEALLAHLPTLPPR